MPVATIETRTETYTVLLYIWKSRYAPDRSTFTFVYYALSDLGSRTPQFSSIEKLQDWLESRSRIQKTRTRC